MKKLNKFNDDEYEQHFKREGQDLAKFFLVAVVVMVLIIKFLL